MADYWRSSGYHLLWPRPDGRLAATDELLRAYLRRPEMRPVAESCPAERALHAELVEGPSMPVDGARVAAIADDDARENWTAWLAFRDRLLGAPSLEDAYLGLVRDRSPRPTPPLFVDQLAHMIVRHVLGPQPDPLRVRAAELFFREQIVAPPAEGAVMLADRETIERHAAAGGDGSGGDLFQLMAAAEASVAPVELDVLGEANAALYWERDERHDMVLDLTFGRAGLDALCRILEDWVAHFLGLRVAIQPVQKISDERWVWHVGLDAEASAILNDLYTGQAVEEGRLARLLSLFRLDFAEPARMRAEIAGRPVYLALAMTPDRQLRLKPQNLLVNLPLAS